MTQKYFRAKSVIEMQNKTTSLYVWRWWFTGKAMQYQRNEFYEVFFFYWIPTRPTHTPTHTASFCARPQASLMHLGFVIQTIKSGERFSFCRYSFIDQKNIDASCVRTELFLWIIASTRRDAVTWNGSIFFCCCCESHLNPNKFESVDVDAKRS